MTANSLCNASRLWILAAAIFLVQTCVSPSVLPAQNAGEDSDRRAVAIYADAAGYQNNGAHELAIEEWQKLLKQFPRDPLASKAWHYLGVCYIQLDAPKYDKAIGAFSQALKDRQLEVREESMINLSWCLFNEARAADPGSAEQRKGLEEAKTRLTQFLREFGDGSYVDQALFYLGEIEYSLGNPSRSIAYYERLVENRSFAKSSLLPDARYAIAVAYEELGKSTQAQRQYRDFLSNHSDHRLASEVRVRLADLLLTADKAAEAESLLAGMSSTAEDSMADYALLRLGYAYSQQKKTREAVAKYRELLQRFPNSQHALTAALSLGQAYFEQGDYDQAIRYFESALAKKDEQAATAAHWLSLTYMRQKEPQRAVRLLEDALTWSRNSSVAVLLQMDYADALYALPDQIEKATAAYELIASEHAEDPLAPRAAYNAAFAALQTGKFAKARQWSESFLQRYPQDALRSDVAYVAAEALLQDGQYKAASQAYTKLRRSYPRNESFALWTLRLAMASYLDSDYETAIDLLENQMASFSDANQRAEAQFIAGASQLYSENPEQAVKYLQASVQSSGQWSSADEVLLLLSDAYKQLGQPENARQSLESLLKKYPKTRLRAQVEYKLAQLAASLENFSDAVSRYQSILRNPDASNYHRFANYGIAWCQMQQDDYQSALRYLEPLVGASQGDTLAEEARLAQGVCYRKLGRVDNAIRSLQTFLDSAPRGVTLGNGLYELGLALTEQGKLRDANRQFLRILQEVPAYPAVDKVLYELAWNYEDSGESDTAQNYFKRLATEFPNSDYGAESNYMLAQQLYEQGQYRQAASMYDKVLKAGPNDELKEKVLYKLGWSLFQQQDFTAAAQQFASQTRAYPRGPLAVDALFMAAECSFEQDQFSSAFSDYQQARDTLERSAASTGASDQVKTLIYLHGAQCLREMKRWSDCQKWLEKIVASYPESPYMGTTLYELGYCKQKQNKPEEALVHYREVAENYRNAVGARARFMMGELYFGKREFAKAIPEFQRVMYGFGGDRAPEEIKNWQVKSAYEAARCSEILIENLRGESRQKVVDTAQEFYRFIVEKHAAHELAAQAQARLGELQKLR